MGLLDKLKNIIRNIKEKNSAKEEEWNHPFSKEVWDKYIKMKEERYKELDEELDKLYEVLGRERTKPSKQANNIRQTIEKCEIKHPETIESLEDKITQTNMEMKKATSRDEIAKCIADLDWYKQELRYLKRIQGNNSNEKSEITK